MGTITTGVGLISGIDIASLIDNLIAVEARAKTPLQLRLATLQTRKTALLDINARLLNLKNASSAFRLSDIFQSALASSTDEDVLTATATGAAQPGTYSFLVKQLVSTSAKLSRGFADRDTTPVGLTSLTIEMGGGQVAPVTDLAYLNGGAGVRRGKIQITDTSSAKATIDLSSATTITEVLDAINSNATVNVTAKVEGDHLVITDNAGGAGNLDVANAVGSFTATDLGIVGNDPSEITGSDISILGGAMPLDLLNDGTGALIRNGVPDLHIETRDAAPPSGVFDIDFGRVDNPITASTLLEDLNDGAGVRINSDTDDPDIKFVDRDGNEHEIELTGISTVGELQSRVSSQSGGNITITIHADGDKFTVNDTTGGSGLLKIQGAGSNGTQVATDLGILNEAGVPADMFDGQALANADHTPAARTIQEIIDRINNAKDNADADNAGRIVASIAPDGVSLLITDTTGGGGNLIVTSTTGNPYLARDLGIDTGAGGVPAATVDGNRLIAGLNTVLVRSLNGGNGLNGDTMLAITDRDGNGDLFTLDEDDSLSEIIDQINASGLINVEATLNEAGNGLLINDLTGNTAFNLEIIGDAADDLGIDTGAGGVAADSFRGDNLQTRYIAEATRLDDLNYGRGIAEGSFRILDGNGKSVVINIGSDSQTVYDVIDEINALASANSVKISARVNDTGDGILIENTITPVPTGIISVVAGNGTTAEDLGILGQAQTDGGPIDGSYEKVISVFASDTVDEIVEAINEAGIPVNATVLNTQAAVNPIHVQISSEVAGRRGELIVDAGGFNFGITTLTEGRDSKVFFGSDDPAKGTLIQRTSNTLDDVIPGITLDLVSPSTNPVTVSVSRDTQTILDAVSRFVTTFNDTVGRIDQYDFFDVDTEERGPLLGNPTTSAIRSALFRTIQRSAQGLDTEYTFLHQVGIRVGANGQLTFDQDDFLESYNSDPEAVEALFAAFEATTAQTEEIAPGVTVLSTDQTFTKLGFGDLFDQLLDGLTNSIDGVVTLADQGFDDQIELINTRIEDFDDRLEAKRERLERQFLAMEAALAQLQSQSNALISLSSNLSLAQNLLGG